MKTIKDMTLIDKYTLTLGRVYFISYYLDGGTCVKST